MNREDQSFVEHCKTFAEGLGGPEPRVPRMASGSAYEDRVLREWEMRVDAHYTPEVYRALVHKLYRLAEVAFRATGAPAQDAACVCATDGRYSCMLRGSHLPEAAVSASEVTPPNAMD